MAYSIGISGCAKQGQGSINCGILATGMGGSGDKERKWEGKVHPQGLKMLFLHLSVINGPNRA